MGQSASRRIRSQQPQTTQQDEPRPQRRPRNIRNSLLSLMSSNDGSGANRRASRRWSRAPQQPAAPKPEAAVVVQPADDEDEEEQEEESVELVVDPPEPDIDDNNERPRTPLPPATVTPLTPDVPPIRGFPPAGTLVIVQGVVHTTDILRPPSPSQTAPPAISNSSIDVLGTLLTVAAQATAASLLSGSTNNTASPTHPSPQYQPPSARRRPWSALRERLGPTSLPALPTPAPPTPTPAAPNASPQDERARMLAEMARAFNVGLGLSPPAPNSSPPNNNAEDNNTESREEADPPMAAPEEGTFDRFLVDLQSELRVALAPERNNSAMQDEDSRPYTTPLPDSPTLEPLLESNEEIPDLMSIENVNSEESTAPEPRDDRSIVEPQPQDSISPEQTESTPIPHPSGTSPGAVNWWRLHRFAAIPVLARSPTPPPTSNSLVPTPLEEQPSSVPDSPPSPETSSSQRTVVPVIIVGLQSVQVAAGVGPSFPAPVHSDVPNDGIHGVIPMRSPEITSPSETVSTRRRSWWQPRLRPSSTATPPPAQTTATEEEADTEDIVAELEVDDEPEVDTNSSSSHQSPSQSSPPSNAATTDSSRTFLIYVIGGYYPPEHGILTSGGTPESFEALLELGELLGHIRPPTASKADIARAGLAIVKRDELEGLSVTASCAEKCLICLDDYTEEDPIRVLNCRHAFHQGCVDKWLETGRNNCPACRTKGVPTENTGFGSGNVTAPTQV
ncbi:RING finger protein [Mycena indigotica]|uniref:RING finger protein n=1 Tax=Mycena indigotica TaxID=2126181 RepID=A0A8H6VR18_9AGAR|nr:RING finger protein [Mycena indigotica]KAF7290564.1 RING finger protein [Mycena indigotica]